MSLASYMRKASWVLYGVFLAAGMLLTGVLLESVYESRTTYDASLNIQQGYADVLGFVLVMTAALVYAASGVLLGIVGAWRRSIRLFLAGAACLLLAALAPVGFFLVMDLVGEKRAAVFCRAQGLSALLDERARLGRPPPASLIELGEPAKRLVGFARKPPGVMVMIHGGRLLISRGHHENWAHTPGEGWAVENEDNATGIPLPECPDR